MPEEKNEEIIEKCSSKEKERCGGRGSAITTTVPSYSFGEAGINRLLLRCIPWRTMIHVTVMYPGVLWWIPNLFKVVFEHVGLSAKELVWCSVVVVDSCDHDDETWSMQGVATHVENRKGITVFINKESYASLLEETKNQEIADYAISLIRVVWHELQHYYGNHGVHIDDETLDEIATALSEELMEELKEMSDVQG